MVTGVGVGKSIFWMFGNCSNVTSNKKKNDVDDNSRSYHLLNACSMIGTPVGTLYA